MTRKRPSRLRDEVRALRAEVARLRAEVAAARGPVLPSPPLDTSDLPTSIGGCSACRWSGVCNCVRYDQMPRTYANVTAAAPLKTTLRLAPGTARMIPVPNANACAGWPPVTIYDATGPAQPFTVHVENTIGCTPGAGDLSIFGGS